MAAPLFGAITAAIAPQAPSVVAIGRQLRDRRLIQQLEDDNGWTLAATGEARVCLFADALDHASGVSRFVSDLAADAQRSDRRLTVFTAGHSLDSFLGDVRVFPSLGDISVPGYAGLRLAVPWLAEMIEASAGLDPDVIHVSTPGPVGVAGALTAALLRIPLVGAHHTDYPAYAQRLLGPSAAGIATKLLSLLYERCDLVLARSRASAQLLATLGVPVERIESLPAGIDLSRFGPGFRDEAIWRRFPHVNPQAVKALYVGRLSKEKNLPTLTRLWRCAERRLAPLGLCAQLLVVGDGPWREEMARDLAGAGAIFLGPQTGQTLARLYASSDFFVFPSITETLGQVVIEAQASGLPALVADAGGSSELVLDGATGRLLAPDDEPAWVEAIVNLVRNSYRRAQLSRRAVEHARMFSFDHTAGAFWAAHERLVSRDGKLQSLQSPRSAPAMETTCRGDRKPAC